MKTYSLFSRTAVATMAMLLSFGAVQVNAVDRNNEDEVVKIDARRSPFDYREGELIVKFKPASSVRVLNTKGKFRTASVKAIDAVMQELGGFEMEELMPLSGAKVSSRQVKSYTGKTIADRNLGKLYRVKFDAAKVQTVHEAIEKFKKMSDVEFAEPNYMMYATATNDAETYATDPLYSQQWGFDAINLPALWNAPKITDKRPVIAIIDTGVEFTHTDLFNNIWANEKELVGEEGVDDDGNGFVDDMYGWDFVNQNNRMDDYNGHGTHCAGIAAATAANGKGGVGANPDALIMPVSVLQSDGKGDVATFIKGIDYATANGADVISMSLGSYAESMALEQALAKAYQKAVLVAAAGNDGMCIYPHKCVHPATGLPNDGSPMFPAAYTFVLGVQASAQGGGLAGFSNYDEDGPIYSTFGEEKQYNYELTAPGVNVMSTYPGGKYKALNGTSMACPLVAGAVSRLLQCKEYDSKEMLFGDLIHSTTSAGNFDIYVAYQLDNSKRQPTLWNIANELNDTEGGDGDMRADAGETIKVYPTLRNDWGLAQNIKISLEMGENEDASLVRFVSNDVAFGTDLSSYAKAKSVNPIVIKINDDCVDGRRIKLRLRATCDNISSELVQDFTITVENGVEIGGIITKDTTLYPDVHYIVTKNLVITGCTLTILPGTILTFKEGVDMTLLYTSNPRIICKGTPDSPIVFTHANPNGEASSLFFHNGEFEYVRFENMNLYTGSTSITFRNIKVKNCEFKNCCGVSEFIWCHNFGSVTDCDTLQQCNFYFNYGKYESTACRFSGYIKDSNIIGHRGAVGSSRIYNSNTFGNYCESSKREYMQSVTNIYDPNGVFTPIYPLYHGSSREDIVRYGIYDLYHPTNPTGNYLYDLSNMLTRPSAEAHGIVWKVVVNGYDAQDEYELLPPLGVGRHKFEVYFNRPMNTAVAPTIAMGVRPPYTQNSIAEDGTWSADSLVYTAYLTITGKTATDGVNRIYVAGAEDNEYFEIPIEAYRFNVNVQSAGSMSTGFAAEAGLGKVNLTWESPEEEIDDLLGYNMYRYTMVNDSVASDTMKINTRMIESTEFTDFDVVPGETYYYYYKVLRTSLTENSPSRIVASTPLTAAKGDANGSMSVDVADVVTQVAYMTKQNPQPFIFEAADVNSDLAVNVLDVVGTINIIRNPAGTSSMSVNSTAIYTIEDGVLYVESPVALGGVQFRFNVSTGAEITPLEALNGFETVGDNQGENGYLFMAFSMTGRTISAGKQALLRIGSAEMTEIVLCDATGKSIIGIDGNTSGVGAIEAMQMELPYPNPFSDVLTVPYKVGKDGLHDVKIVVSSVTGATVATYSAKNTYGTYTWTWNAGESVSAGVYFVSLYVDGSLMQTAKAVKR